LNPREYQNERELAKARIGWWVQCRLRSIITVSMRLKWRKNAKPNLDPNERLKHNLD